MIHLKFFVVLASFSNSGLLADLSVVIQLWMKETTLDFRYSSVIYDVIPIAFAVLGLAFVFALYIIHLIALSYGWSKLHRPNSEYHHHLMKQKGTNGKTYDLPGVTIIKPLVGIDANLETNLTSFFNLDYPKYEIFFCVHRREDEAVGVAKKLMLLYPDVSARIFYGGENVGLNPKINNMMPAYRASQYPFILISDSGILMRTDALKDMVETMLSGERNAIVTQTPYCLDRPGFANTVEQIYFGTSHGRIYLAGNCLGFVCSTGMSSLLRKKALDECGGIRAFGDYLAEDFFFGLILSRRNWHAAISSYPALQNTADLTLSKFHNRICRWMKLRIAMLPHIIFVEPIQDCFPSGIIFALVSSFLFGANPLKVFLFHCIFWLVCDYNLLLRMQNGFLKFSFNEFLVGWFLREILSPLNFFRALLNPDIEWRHGRFRLHWGGRIKSHR
ncbi:unnamed protein product [Auanema sp. JU1783]|nr:unnamed protein product [Auanema sp. JU1783]